jgi:hypothetical protein
VKTSCFIMAAFFALAASLLSFEQSIAQTPLTTAAPTTVVGVGSPAWFWSPGAWVTDRERSSGLDYAQTNQQGCYARLYFSSKSPQPTCSVTFDCSMYSGLPYPPIISYSVDGSLTDNVSLSGDGADIVSIPVTGSGEHVVTIWCRNAPQAGGWGGAAPTNNAVYRIDNARIDNQSSAGAAPAWDGRWIWIIGPSTCAGTRANNGQDDSLVAYSHLEGEAFHQLGYEYSVKAFGYWGLLAPGDADSSVPPFYAVTGSTNGGNGTLEPSSWDKLDPENSLLDSRGQISAYGPVDEQPFLIQLNFGGNECRIGSKESDMEASVSQCLVALRRAAPNAWIFVGPEQELGNDNILGNSGSKKYVSAIDNAVEHYHQLYPLDSKTVLIDLTATLSPPLASAFYGDSGFANSNHCNAAGHALEASVMLAFIQQKIDSANKTNR